MSFFCKKKKLMVKSSFNKAYIYKNRIEWIHGTCSYPEILLQDSHLHKKVVTKQITNPYDLAYYLIESRNLPISSPNILWKRVLQNPEIKSIQRIRIVFKILIVSQNPEKSLADITHLLYRYELIQNFRTLIDICYEKKEKCNAFMSNKKILHSIEILKCEDSDIDFIGQLALPPNYRLLRSKKELLLEGLQMNNCLSDCWEEMDLMLTFYIVLDYPVKTAFSVNYNSLMSVFVISEARTKCNEEADEKYTRTLARFILTTHAQTFFYNNSKNIDIGIFNIPEITVGENDERLPF